MIGKRIPWASLKNLVDTKKLRLQYYEHNGAYIIEVADGAIVYESIINIDDEDIADVVNDFETNYIPNANQQLEEMTPEFGAKKVALYKPEESSTSRTSHDWTDKCTWYSKATEVIGEALTEDTTKVYPLANVNIIDVRNGRIYMEDDLQSYAIKVYDDGVELTEKHKWASAGDYTVNFETGTITIESGYTVNGSITADYHFATSSEWCLKPEAGKKLILEHSELQVSEDVNMVKPIRFTIWVGNPYFNPANPVVEWFEGAQFGVDNFLQFPYKTIRYKSIKDIINGANLGQGFIPKCSGLTQNILVFPFNYISLQTLKSSDLAELRITVDDDEPMTGEWGTVTFYVMSDTE